MTWWSQQCRHNWRKCRSPKPSFRARSAYLQRSMQQKDCAMFKGLATALTMIIAMLTAVPIALVMAFG